MSSMKRELKRLKSLVDQHRPEVELPPVVFLPRGVCELIDLQSRDEQAAKSREKQTNLTIETARQTLSPEQRFAVDRGAHWVFAVTPKEQLTPDEWQEKAAQGKYTVGVCGVFSINSKFVSN